MPKLETQLDIVGEGLVRLHSEGEINHYAAMVSTPEGFCFIACCTVSEQLMLNPAITTNSEVHHVLDIPHDSESGKGNS